MPHPALAARKLLTGISPDVFAPAPTPFTAQDQSIDFDGATEFMSAAAPALIGIANTWTIAAWAKFDDVTTRSGTIFGIGNAVGAANGIEFHQRHAGPTGPLGIQLLISDSATILIQNCSWQNILKGAGFWSHIVVQWAGTVASRKLFYDGVDQGVPTFGSPGSPGTQTDTARLVTAGKGLSGVTNHDGREGSVAVWNSILSAAEIKAIKNGGVIDFDLKTNQGNYASAGNLQHWWEMGKQASPNLGADSA